MKLSNYEHVESQPVDMDGASGCRVRWLVGEADGAPNFAMRQFDVAPGGHTPKHGHSFEHEVFVLEGEGVVCEGDVEHPLKAGDVVFVEPDEVHQFRNSGHVPLKFLCLIPITDTSKKTAVAPECGCED